MIWLIQFLGCNLNFFISAGPQEETRESDAADPNEQTHAADPSEQTHAADLNEQTHGDLGNEEDNA